jgi:phosphoribosylglycinamide formyltransferase 1
MRIGILASSGGSAFIEAWKILCKCSSTKHEYFIITDRECGIEVFCRENNISCKRIEYTNRKKFSADTSIYIQNIGGLDVIFLYFLRILTEEVFTKYPCLNIHPSLLPAFKGLNAVDQFLQSGAKFMGATLHIVDQGIDTGTIIAQIQTPTLSTIERKKANKISFLQKVYLTLVGIELVERSHIIFNADFSEFKITENLPFSAYANPVLQNIEFLQGFLKLQHDENTLVIKI